MTGLSRSQIAAPRRRPRASSIRARAARIAGACSRARSRAPSRVRTVWPDPTDGLRNTAVTIMAAVNVRRMISSRRRSGRSAPPRGWMRSTATVQATLRENGFRDVEDLVGIGRTANTARRASDESRARLCDATGSCRRKKKRNMGTAGTRQAGRGTPTVRTVLETSLPAHRPRRRDQENGLAQHQGEQDGSHQHYVQPSKCRARSQSSALRPLGRVGG
jgi:hypothetical protein